MSDDWDHLDGYEVGPEPLDDDWPPPRSDLRRTITRVVAALVAFGMVIGSVVALIPRGGAAGWVTLGPVDRFADSVVLIRDLDVLIVPQDNQLIGLITRVPGGGRVRYCSSSGFLEGLDGENLFDLAGVHRDGPAPRGLDRRALRTEDGLLQVDMSRVLQGPPVGTPGEDPSGPFCTGERSLEA